MLENRLFLATAAHLLKNDHEYEILLPEANCPIVDAFEDVHIDTSNDIACVEMRPSVVENLYDRFIKGDQILSQLDAEKEWPVFIIGYPGQLISSARAKSAVDGTEGTLYTYVAFTIPTVSISASRWKSKSFERPASSERDLFLEHDPGNTMDLLHASNAGNTPPKIEMSPPDVFGMSGGAIWLKRAEQGLVWCPSLRLIGVQVSWNTEHTRLRGTRIDCWLTLVDRKYPELRRCISGIRKNET